MAKQITKRTLVGYRDARVNTRYFEDLINQLKDKRKCESFIKKVHQGKTYWNRKEDDNMKFNAVVGNPPYQEEGINNNKKDPIYPYFWDAAIQISSLVTLITPARFLFDAGQTSKEWNKKMLDDNHLSVIKYFSNPRDVFPTADIKGGVSILLWDNANIHKNIGTFIPNETLNSISEKFNNLEEFSLASIMYGGRSDLKFNNLFLEKYPNSPSDRLTAIKKEHPNAIKLAPNEEYELKSSTLDVLKYVFQDQEPEDNKKYYKILGLINNKRVYKWIEKEYMTPRYLDSNNLDYFKVFIPKAIGSGKFGEQLSNVIIAGPDVSSTPSFIGIGRFHTQEEANNLAKYLKTKLSRALLGILKITQDVTPAKYSYVPLQDFTPQSDIDWSKSIDEIDQQLYKKYKLSEDEIDFIEKNVKPMK